ncbi:MAG: hypothetical protein R3E18_06120 [Sphingomonadaceae bacterium]|nr:hypothetical protein [Sphingomonadaceae bacterium]
MADLIQAALEALVEWFMRSLPRPAQIGCSLLLVALIVAAVIWMFL